MAIVVFFFPRHPSDDDIVATCSLYTVNILKEAYRLLQDDVHGRHAVAAGDSFGETEFEELFGCRLIKQLGSSC